MDPNGSIHSHIYSILYLRTVLAMSLKQHIYSFEFSNADPYKSKWIHKDPYGSMWIHMDPYGSIWIHMEPFRSIWSIWIRKDPYVFALVAPMLAPSLYPLPSREHLPIQGKVKKSKNSLLNAYWILMNPFGSIWVHTKP